MQTPSEIQDVLEFLSLEVPMKKLHPRFSNEEKNSEEEILIYSSPTESDNKEEDVIDPRWQKLKNLEDDNKKQAKNN